MNVEQLMTANVVTADIEETVRTAVAAMLSNHVGSVIVSDDGNPTGIITETDVLQAGYATDEAFSEVPLKHAMSHPLTTIAPDKSLRTAMRTMKDENIKKLPVRDGLDLVGILTMTDVTRQYNEIVQEIHEMEQGRGLSGAELRGLGSQSG
jgi:CBS domain-containing protein